MHKHRALGREDVVHRHEPVESNFSEPVGPIQALRAGSSQGPVSSLHGGPTSAGLEGRHSARERPHGWRGTGEGKPVGLLLRFCGGNCLS